MLVLLSLSLSPFSVPPASIKEFFFLLVSSPFIHPRFHFRPFLQNIQLSLEAFGNVGALKLIDANAAVHNLTDICWKKCITGSIRSGKLDRGEETCTQSCVDRFLDSNFLVIKHLESMRNQSWAGDGVAICGKTNGQGEVEGGHIHVIDGRSGQLYDVGRNLYMYELAWEYGTFPLLRRRIGIGWSYIDITNMQRQRFKSGILLIQHPAWIFSLKRHVNASCKGVPIPIEKHLPIYPNWREKLRRLQAW